MSKTIFTKDKANLTLTAQRTFNASQHAVWKAYTTAEMLEKWFGPHPWYVTTVSMDFSVGGGYHYCMNGPEGEKMYALTKYTEIRPEEYYSSEDYFVDESGTIDEHMPAGMKVENTFISDGDKTQLVSVTTFANPEAMQQMIEMGAQEGLGITLDQLDDLLTNT